MRVVFIGASRFGLRCLDVVRALPGMDVVGVVTNAAVFTISYAPAGVTNVLHADIASYAAAAALPCAVMQKNMTEPELIAQVAAWRPELFLVVGWYHMVPRRWRVLAPAFGLHASLLPDYSGGAPLVWAMIDGAKQTGITLFQMGDGVDDGPILGQAATEILAADTIATLYARIETLGLGLLRRELPRLAQGEAVLTPQDEAARRVFPQRKPEDGRIDWHQDAARIYDFIRAQTRPYPGAFSVCAGRRLTIWAAQPTLWPDQAAVAGALVQTKDGKILVVCAYGTALELIEVGKADAPVSASEWWRSLPEPPGAFDAD